MFGFQKKRERNTHTCLYHVPDASSAEIPSSTTFTLLFIYCCYYTWRYSLGSRVFQIHPPATIQSLVRYTQEHTMSTCFQNYMKLIIIRGKKNSKRRLKGFLGGVRGSSIRSNNDAVAQWMAWPSIQFNCMPAHGANLRAHSWPDLPEALDPSGSPWEGKVVLTFSSVGFGLIREDAQSQAWVAKPFFRPCRTTRQASSHSHSMHLSTLKDLTEAALLSLMPLRNFNLRQPLSSTNFPYYNILLLFYLTCQFGLISLTASEKQYVTRSQKTLNLIECPQTFWPFIFTRLTQ